MSSTPGYHERKKQELEEAIHQTVTERLRALAADPAYRATAYDGDVRAAARRRLLRQIRMQFPEATLPLLQRVISKVAQDLTHCHSKGH